MIRIFRIDSLFHLTVSFSFSHSLSLLTDLLVLILTVCMQWQVADPLHCWPVLVPKDML